MLKEEASICKRDQLAQQQQQKQQQQEQQLNNQPYEQNNPSLKKQKQGDPLENIPVEMPSFMDDLD